MIFVNNYIIILFKHLFVHIRNVPMNHFIKTYILMIIFVRYNPRIRNAGSMIMHIIFFD